MSPNRTIQREISDPMAVRILQGSLSDGDTVTVEVVDDRIALR
jgi:ATP-dependent Clp protease ATP-binding subunit ClpA